MTAFMRLGSLQPAIWLQLVALVSAMNLAWEWFWHVWVKTANNRLQKRHLRSEHSAALRLDSILQPPADGLDLQESSLQMETHGIITVSVI